MTLPYMQCVQFVLLSSFHLQSHPPSTSRLFYYTVQYMMVTLYLLTLAAESPSYPFGHLQILTFILVHQRLRHILIPLPR